MSRVYVMAFMCAAGLAGVSACGAEIEDEDDIVQGAIGSGIDPKKCVLTKRAIRYLEEHGLGGKVFELKCNTTKGPFAIADSFDRVFPEDLLDALKSNFAAHTCPSIQEIIAGFRRKMAQKEREWIRDHKGDGPYCTLRQLQFDDLPVELTDTDTVTDSEALKRLWEMAIEGGAAVPGGGMLPGGIKVPTYCPQAGTCPDDPSEPFTPQHPGSTEGDIP